MALELSGLTLHSFSQGQVGSQETTYSYVYIFSVASHPHSPAGVSGEPPEEKKGSQRGEGLGMQVITSPGQTRGPETP